MGSVEPRRRLDELPPAYTSVTPGQRLVTLAESDAPGYSSRFLPDDEDQNDQQQPVSNEIRSEPTVELPPVYTPFDEWAKTFSICGSIINTVSSEGLDRPRYQLKEQLSPSGKLWRLQIRRLLPSESRRLSMSSEVSVDFDVDTMMYEVENIGSLHALQKQNLRIRGRRAGTLQGLIELKPAGRDGFDFNHCTQPPAKHWSREENMRKMQKWGYKADQEWEKKPLFTCRSVGRKGDKEWTKKNDLLDEVVVIANEMNGELIFQKQVPERIRDALVTCWAAGKWSTGKLNDGTSRDVHLSRWRTIG